MKKLLNTLYVTSSDSYLSIDGENIVVSDFENELGRFPLHNLEAIVSFGYRGVSPGLMGGCVKRNIELSFMTPQGKFLASVNGEIKGNVFLRKKQYQISDDSNNSLYIARNFILGKVSNSKVVLDRAIRDHGMQLDLEKTKKSSLFLGNALKSIRQCDDIEQLRGYEGEAASIYFNVFNELILQQKKDFVFNERNRRPPLDNVNALLSFSYTLLANMVRSALECVGLDPFVGFMHTDRPGRASLALDLMEELRPIIADRFVINLINNRKISKKDFERKENGAVLLKDDARKMLIIEWQDRKKDVIKHPYLDEKVEWGMIPYVQSMLLARYIRGDLDGYPPFFWR